MSAEPLDRDTRDAVTDVLLRYATAIDSRDWDLFRTCFTDDVAADYGDIGVWDGVEELTDWMRVVHDACGHTLHRITNVVATRAGAGRVTTRAYVDAIVLGPDDATGARAAGFYDDELVETDEGWRIAHRAFTSAFVEKIG